MNDIRVKAIIELDVERNDNEEIDIEMIQRAESWGKTKVIRILDTYPEDK